MSNKDVPTQKKNWLIGPDIHLKVISEDNLIKNVLLTSSKNKGISLEVIDDSKNDDIFKLLTAWLDQYCEAKTPLIMLPFDWKQLPHFSKTTLQQLQEVPFGVIYTYGEFAKQLNLINGASAVGKASRINPFPLFVPCHRIIDTNHEFRNYSPEHHYLKKHLIEWERHQMA